MSAINAKASRKMKKYAVLTREPRCFLGSFDFSWEQRKLGELVDVCSGRDYKHLSEGTIPVYGTGGYMLSVNDALSYDRDAIGIGRKGTIDRPYILKAPFWTVDTLFYAIPREKADLNFAFDIFQNIDWKKKDESTGVPSLSKTAINDIDVLAPKHGEQQTIGQFFAAIDHLITLHQRKCANLCSPSQVVFSLLFATSTFSWEQRKLGEMGQTYTGLSGKTKDDFGHGQARFVTYMNVFSNPISNPEMTEPIEIDPKQNEVEVGDVFFTTSSETPEEVGMSSILLEKRGKTYLNSFCFGFRPSEKIDSYYLAYMLRSESTRAKIILLAQGISRYNISKNKVMEIAVSLPSLDEQKMIGQYFSQLDNLITLHQRECISFTGRADRLILTANKKRTTSSWEQRKLSEITDKVTEKNAGLQYVETFTNSAEFGIISQRDFFDHDIAKLGSLDGYYIVKNEDFVYNPRISTSAPVGPINRNKLGRTGVMSPLYTVFRPHDIDTTYLEYFFKCGYWHSFMNFNGDSGARSDRFSIRDNVFFQMPIPIPDIDEQRKIGELLTCLDNLITLHQRELEKLQNIKKSMLEKMFV